jgi:hypothetical protein
MIWILRDGTLVAVVQDMATATKLLPWRLTGEWTLQLVDLPPTPPAIDTVAALLRSLETRKISSPACATSNSVVHLTGAKGEEHSIRAPENKITSSCFSPLHDSNADRKP